MIVPLREQVERDGYAILEGAFGDHESRALREAAMRIVEPALASRVDDPRYHYDDDGVTLKHIDWPSDLDDEFARLIAHPAIVSLLNDVVGPDVQLAFGKLVVKQPRKPGLYEWHQDLVYLKHTNDQLFAVALQLDDFSDGEGAVRIVPGSHRAGLVPHHPTGGYVSDASYLSPVVTLAVPRGALTVHHSLALHRSPPSAAGELRLRALYFYRASDAHPVGRKSHLGGRHADVQVSGEPRPARHQALAWDGVFR
jgi:hypothetical protein